MNIVVAGTVEKVSEIRTFPSHTGESFSSQEIVVKNIDDTRIAISVFGEKSIAFYDFKIGMEVMAICNLQCRETARGIFNYVKLLKCFFEKRIDQPVQNQTQSQSKQQQVTSSQGCQTQKPTGAQPVQPTNQNRQQYTQKDNTNPDDLPF